MDARLDVRKTLPENAQDYYGRSKKAKAKIPGLEKAIEDTRAQIERLTDKILAEGREREQKAAKSTRKIKWFEKFRWFVSSDGFLVIGGRDATSNEIVIKKHTDASDLVFHADVQGAPFFVVKNPDKNELPEDTVREAAEAAASYSSGWKKGVGELDVYYIMPEQVSKTPESGEYLAKGAFVIRGKRNWMRKTSLRLAVGVGEDDAVLGGPVSAIEKACSVLAVIAPGDLKQGEAVKRVSEILGCALLSDVQRFVPGGKTRIIK
ncbi:MAG: NFACT RNA binding domain-containing protein [Candidatus Altiarchaeota archaeon]